MIIMGEGEGEGDGEGGLEHGGGCVVLGFGYVVTTTNEPFLMPKSANLSNNCMVLPLKRTFRILSSGHLTNAENVSV